MDAYIRRAYLLGRLSGRAGKNGEPAFSPGGDGTTHVNVYSGGATRLGRDLSNFAPIPGGVETPWGRFSSIEGLWHFLLVREGAPGVEELRKACGMASRDIGKRLRDAHPRSYAERLPPLEFRAAIQTAILEKLGRMPGVCEALAALPEEVPLVHYYVFGRGEESKMVPGSGPWLIDFLEHVRAELRAG